ncbi:helix-turn-helix domain-containing protein [Mycobacterium sp. 21AC1]|uniref:PucR family transcriptional regulator n=1 Tax=[Mycobacterium] appelbergii TaxID=2939269 RepID=UPI0029390FB5|nr:helix-turn-helix domain-containing protein [Mycobacterium sp. 21AC1]MDV3128590.1 helix-turn-helix domain-containing protein [Mycobacterium sp. 21AC1]
MAVSVEDLFELAHSLAELVGGPITIEDENSAVLAYSGGAQAVDDARIDTILGRRVPGRYRQVLVDAGVFDRLSRETGVIYVDLSAGGMTPRAVIAVRHSGVLVGSIWAAVTAPPTAEQERAMRSSAALVARRIVVERDRADRARRSRQELVETLIVGGEPAERIADELGMSGPLTVAAFAGTGQHTLGLTGSLDLHLQAQAIDSVVGRIDDVVYAVLGCDEPTTVRVLREFVDRLSGAVLAAVGRQIDGAVHTHLSRSDADRTLAVLRSGQEWGRVATIHDCLGGVLALRSAAVLDGLVGSTPLGRISRFDRDHGSELVTSVAAFLNHGGDIGRAAMELHVHPNTLRNRLRRTADSCGVDVADPDIRLVLMLELRLAALRR